MSTTTLPTINVETAIRSTTRIPSSSLSDRQRYLASLTPTDLQTRLHQVAHRFEVARAAFEDSLSLSDHRHLATTCETIAQDVLETACAVLGDAVFQTLLDAAYVVEEGLFDPDDERYLM